MFARLMNQGPDRAISSGRYRNEAAGFSPPDLPTLKFSCIA
jgi:hypothetical protein